TSLSTSTSCGLNTPVPAVRFINSGVSAGCAGRMCMLASAGAVTGEAGFSFPLLPVPPFHLFPAGTTPLPPPGGPQRPGPPAAVAASRTTLRGRDERRRGEGGDHAADRAPDVGLRLAPRRAERRRARQAARPRAGAGGGQVAHGAGLARPGPGADAGLDRGD